MGHIVNAFMFMGMDFRVLPRSHHAIMTRHYTQNDEDTAAAYFTIIARTIQKCPLHNPQAQVHPFPQAKCKPTCDW